MLQTEHINNSSQIVRQATSGTNIQINRITKQPQSLNSLKRLFAMLFYIYTNKVFYVELPSYKNYFQLYLSDHF